MQQHRDLGPVNTWAYLFGCGLDWAASLRWPFSRNKPYLKRAAWSLTAEKGLTVAARGDLPWIRQEVEKGVSALFECCIGPDRWAWIVLRYEPDQEEMVLVVGEGRGFKHFVPVVEHYARQMGAKTVRTHIQRPGLKRWYESLEWQQAEIVMRKTL
ncbi:hypothetical protein HBA55_34415 [Pseudomaricurvus alkylphenolicus]|uniref:hypothetical protein n=1 Tax=Pseudomaricurvus alkylphenolicus TaxID=1306991 RepID=UPI0014219A27|nr:hypothetical protein [Pseudomaricurvus alkylphenolicus]NIB44725.1 hypothetical protein [Pseudomaricurvus alkylphenolicus]